MKRKKNIAKTYKGKLYNENLRYASTFYICCSSVTFSGSL